jgi:hypothetical protein
MRAYFLSQTAQGLRARVRRVLYGRFHAWTRIAQARAHTRFLKGDPQMPTGYCVKERKKVEIKDPQQVTMKNGRPAIQGTCPDCGTKIFKIGKL